MSNYLEPSCSRNMNMSKPTILIIDDDIGITDSLSMLLEDEGYTVAVARNGAEGLEYLSRAETLPRMIFLDLMMPIMDGFAFREEQLKNAGFASVPVVVMTAGSLGPRTAELNVVECLRKPLKIERLLQLACQHHEAA